MRDTCTDCSAPATQLMPVPLCSLHWAERYSKGPLTDDEGNQLPYKKSLQQILKEMGYWKEENESVEEWQERCKKHTSGKKIVKRMP